MRKTTVILIGSLLLCMVVAAPAFALPYTSWAELDFSSLTITGIGYTLSEFEKGMAVSLGTFSHDLALTFTRSSSWDTSGTISSTLPLIGHAEATSNRGFDGGSLSLDSELTRGGFASDRSVAITALNTGTLDVSVPFTLGERGPMSGNRFSYVAVIMQFCITVCTHSAGSEIFNFPFGDYPLSSVGQTKSGILSLSVPFTQGQTATLGFSARSNASVPEPDILWLTLIGLFVVAVYTERTRRRVYAA